MTRIHALLPVGFILFADLVILWWVMREMPSWLSEVHRPQDLFSLVVALSILFVGFTSMVLVWQLVRPPARYWSSRPRSPEEALQRARSVLIHSLARQAELRDPESGQHLARTSVYVRLIGEQLSLRSDLAGYISKQYLTDLAESAPLHDVGKIGIPDRILLKPGPLTKAEFQIMMTHVTLGQRLLNLAQEEIGHASFLTMAIQIAGYHHEHWDGTGYPHGVAGEKIPLSARIMAVADVYDALRSERPYKPAWPHQETAQYITQRSGSQFDPKVVEAFVLRNFEFQAVSEAQGSAELRQHLRTG